jgi:hypothetical protein
MRTISPRFMTEPQPFWEVPPAGFRDVLETKATGTLGEALRGPEREVTMSPRLPSSPTASTPSTTRSTPMSSGRRPVVPVTEAWHVSRTLRTMELLAIAPRSAPELAEGLGIHVRTARRVLKRVGGGRLCDAYRGPPTALPADHASSGPRRARRRWRGAQSDRAPAHGAAPAGRRKLPPLRTEPQVDPLPRTRGRREHGHT